MVATDGDRHLRTSTWVARNASEAGRLPISVSRTVNTPLSKLYKSFANTKSRSAWLWEDGLVVRTATPDKSMRVTWNDKKTSLEMNFYAKAADKSQVVVQHSKLPDAKSSAKMKTYWGKTLDRLRTSLEK